VNWLIILVGTAIGGGIGWWLGAHVSLMTAYLLSIAGTALSFYFCRRFITEHMP